MGERIIIIAGAGIGGLTAALALAQRGRRVLLADAAPRLEEIGAGLQLSPNASRILQALGVTERLARHVSLPSSLLARDGYSGRTLAELALGRSAEERYGAPYWVLHRADLQRVLLEACQERPEITIRLGAAYLRHAASADQVQVTFRTGNDEHAEAGAALVGADGLWSSVRGAFADAPAPRFQRRIASRALVAPEVLPAAMRTANVHLWLGPDAHLVHYPVRGGRSINVVAVTAGADQGRGWSTPAQRAALQQHFRDWAEPVRGILAAPDLWTTWSLYGLPPLSRWSAGRVTLLGDAAHAMVPFIAQGAGMAIEDAAVLTSCIADVHRSGIPAALHSYEKVRLARANAVAAAARRTGAIYHLTGPAAFARNLAMRLLGGDMLRARQDWIYAWRPPDTAD